MVYKHLAPFDPSRDFVTQTFFRASGVAIERGVPFDKSLVDSRLLATLYSTHKIGYADESAAEGAGSIAPATMAELGGGWWAVGAPWLDEPEKVQGEDKARLRAQQIRDEGEPADHHGVVLVEIENGWWALNAAWLAEPEKVHGEEAARERAAALRKAGPPADWVDPASLVGSDAFEANLQIGGETVQLGDIVAAAQAASGHPAEVWNKLEADQRDPLIQAEIDRRTKAAEKKPAALKVGDFVAVDLEGHALHGQRGDIATIDGDDASVKVGDAEPTAVPLSALTASTREPAQDQSGGDAELSGGQGAAGEGPSKDERIAALVTAHDTPALTKLAEGLPGLASAKGKPAIATLIVEADRDVKPAEDDAGGGAA